MAQLKSFTEGMRKYRAGCYDEAIAALSDLVGRDDVPGRIARYYTGMSHRCAGIESMRQGQYEEAACRLHQAVAYLGNKADLAEYLCTVYARTGRVEQSLGQAQIVADSQTQSETAQIRLAHAHFRAGQFPLAILTLHEALRHLGESTDLHRNLGLLYAQQDEYGLAREHIIKATQCDATNDKAWRYLGMVESACGNLHEAAAAFQRAYNLCPDDTLLGYQLCLAAQASRQAGKAFTITLCLPAAKADTSQVRQLAEYVAAQPDFIESFLALPPSPADEELFGLLSTVLKTALADHGQYADLHHHASRTLWRLHDADGALIHGRRAIQINPQYKDALVHLALVEESQGASQEAMEHLNRAVDSGADWADVHLHLGGLYQRGGQARQAVGHYRRVLELNHHCEQAVEQLARLAA